MTDSERGTVRGGRIRAGILLCLLVAIIVGAATVFLQYREDRAAAEAEYEVDAQASPPAGFGDKGIELSSGSGRDVVVMTDLSCPHCQELFASDASTIREIARSGEGSVWLQVLDVRSESRTNTIALGYYLHSVKQPGVDPLKTYVAVSKAVSGLEDDAPKREVESRIKDALAPSVDRVPSEAPRISENDQSWLDARTYENRDTVGAVPAVTVDDEEVATDDLQELVD